MRDHLIERRPPGRPEDNHWMLDLWSSPVAHLVAVYYRELESKARRYRTVCTCGWRSIEDNTPELTDCPVKAALDERTRRAVKYTNVGRKIPVEHVEWLPLDKPVSSK